MARNPALIELAEMVKGAVETHATIVEMNLRRGYEAPAPLDLPALVEAWEAKHGGETEALRPPRHRLPHPRSALSDGAVVLETCGECGFVEGASASRDWCGHHGAEPPGRFTYVDPMAAPPPWCPLRSPHTKDDR